MICIAGKNIISINCLKYVIDNFLDQEVVACINKNDQGINGWQPSFKKFCEIYNIKIVNLDELYPIQNLFFFSLEFDQLIRPERFRSNKLYNIHFSALPAYKGMFTSILPLLHGEEKSGVTFHEIDAGIDTGDIIDQVIFELPINISSRRLYDLFLTYGEDLFKENIGNILSGNYIEKNRQSIKRASYFSKKAIDFSNIQIDINKTAYEIHNQIRAFAFRPYQLPKIFGQQITHSIISEEKSIGKPGTVIEENNFYFKLTSIDYNIMIYKDCLSGFLNAIKENNVDFIDQYLNAGYDVLDQNEKGWDGLIVAAYHENSDIVNKLIDSGANVNAHNINGTSVLMYAMYSASISNRLDILELLVARGGDLKHHDYSGKSVIEYAIDYNNQTVINFLKEHLNE